MKTIAIAGCMPRIGATTQALQAVQVLNSVGYKAAYLESNRNQYLEQLVNVYANTKETKESIQSSGVVMYKRNYAQIANKSNLDYLVKDYGNIDSANFEEASFAEQKIKVVICGSKPNEIFKTQAVLENPIYEETFFVFSFVPEDERVAILSMMSENANRTFFTDIILDPFIEHPSSKSLFQKILSLDNLR